MKASLLAHYLNGTESLVELKASLEKPVDFMRQNIKTRGTSIPIEIEADIEAYPISTDEVKKLCNDFLCKRIDGIEISYIATALELSDCFVFLSDVVEDAISVLSDTSAEEPLGDVLVMDIVNSLDLL